MSRHIVLVAAAMAVCLTFDTGCNDSNTLTGLRSTPAAPTSTPETPTRTAAAPTLTPAAPTLTPAAPTFTPAVTFNTPLPSPSAPTPTHAAPTLPPGTPYPTPFGSFHLSGTVRDVSHHAIEGANVKIMSGPQAGRRTYSDLMGHYELRDLSHGTFIVRAEKGLEGATQTVTINFDTTLDFTIWMFY